MDPKGLVEKEAKNKEAAMLFKKKNTPSTLLTSQIEELFPRSVIEKFNVRISLKKCI
jgi:hypothetical protein